MIILDLQCANNHRFEGWFASREAFDQQSESGLVQCTHCASLEVAALPSGPRVLRHEHAGSIPAPVQAPVPEEAQRLFAMLAGMARKAENVGERFPEEARRIHYDEAPARSIRGQATAEETRDLLEEGILVLPAPVPPESETH